MIKNKICLGVFLVLGCSSLYAGQGDNYFNSNIKSDNLSNLDDFNIGEHWFDVSNSDLDPLRGITQYRDAIRQVNNNVWYLYNHGATLKTENNIVSFKNDNPVGAIMMWGTATIPAGWLELNGQPIDKVKYPVLRNMYGTNVPDLRKNFIPSHKINTSVIKYIIKSL